MEFWTTLIKTNDPARQSFLQDNCTHVTGDYWIYEGDDICMEGKIECLGEGAVPSLGDLSEDELIEGCLAWYGFDILSTKTMDAKDECFICGNCGRRVKQDGSMMSDDEANKMDVDWDKATDVIGHCCYISAGPEFKRPDR